MRYSEPYDIIKQLNTKLDHWQAKAEYYEKLATVAYGMSYTTKPFQTYEEYVEMRNRQSEG